MTTPSEQFQRLRGIGPAKAARLYRCGIRSWASLAEVLDVLSGVPADPDGSLRSLRDEARRHGADEAVTASDDTDRTRGPASPDDDPAQSVGVAVGERLHPFVVRVHLTRTGSPLRCTVTDVRTETERAFPGFPLSDVGEFIEDSLDRSDNPKRAAPPPDAGADADVVVAATSFSSGAVELDAGRLLGGTNRTAILIWAADPAGGERSRPLDITASLDARPYGTGGTEDWQRLATVRTVAATGWPATLVFDRLVLPPGLHRLRVALLAGT